MKTQGIDCISPWGNNTLNFEIHKNHTCMEHELDVEYDFSSQFFLNASENKLDACKGKQNYT